MIRCITWSVNDRAGSPSSVGSRAGQPARHAGTRRRGQLTWPAAFLILAMGDDRSLKRQTFSACHSRPWPAWLSVGDKVGWRHELRIKWRLDEELRGLHGSLSLSGSHSSRFQTRPPPGISAPSLTDCSGAGASAAPNLLEWPVQSASTKRWLSPQGAQRPTIACRTPTWPRRPTQPCSARGCAALCWPPMMAESLALHTTGTANIAIMHTSTRLGECVRLMPTLPCRISRPFSRILRHGQPQGRFLCRSAIVGPFCSDISAALKHVTCSK